MVALPNHHKDIPTIPLTEHLRIVKEKDQRIHHLEKQLRFRSELDAVPAEIMSPAQKVALNTALKNIEKTESDEKGRFLIKKTDEVAKNAGMSIKRFQKHLSYCDEIGILEKETLPVRDEHGQILYTETYIKPTEQTFYPRLYEAEKPRNHGGDRLICKCGSDQVEKKVTYICKCCGEVYNKPPRFNPPEDQLGSTVTEQERENSNPVVPEDQLGSTVTEQERENSNPIVPEDQLGSTDETDRKPNLTLISNNLLQDQLDPTDDSNKHTTPASIPLDPDTVIKNWLEARRGSDHIILSTGIIDNPQGKYIYKPQGYQPDLDAYIAGDIAHIYGSRPLNTETGLTNLLCFEIDQLEQDEQADNYLLDLVRAGAAPVYWCRYANGRQRGHLEIYFDQAIDPEVARLWALEICPELESIPECYPCKEPEDKRKQALSWPLYQRIGGKVYPCKAKFILPSPYTGELQECDPTDKETLAQLVALAVTPSSLIEEFATVLAEREALQPAKPTRDSDVGVFIGKKPKPVTNVGGKDLAKQAIANFCAETSWDDIAAMCEGWDKDYFKAVWRGERTASVRPDSKDSNYAFDYWIREKLDKYEVYCRARNINKRADLADRCAQLRRTEMRVVEPRSTTSPSEELDYDAACQLMVELEQAGAFLEWSPDGQCRLYAPKNTQWQREDWCTRIKVLKRELREMCHE